MSNYTIPCQIILYHVKLYYTMSNYTIYITVGSCVLNDNSTAKSCIHT